MRTLSCTARAYHAHFKLHQRPTSSPGHGLQSNPSCALWCSRASLISSILALFGLLFMSATASAQLAVNTLDPNFIEQGETKDFTLFGRNFADDVMISFTGGQGVSIVGAVELVLGSDAGDGRGDRLTFTASASATTAVGVLNLVVESGDESRTKYSALNIRPGAGGSTGPSDPPPSDPNDQPDTSGGGGSLYDGLPDRESGKINIVTRASPPKGELGGQVNLWLEGREFPSDITIKFGVDMNDILPAEDADGMPISPPQVYRNTSDTNGEMDGILYYIRIGYTAPLGDVPITLQSPSTGASYTADEIFEIVPEGEGLIFNGEGAEDIEAVTSASPVAIRAGRNAAMWILGEGFNIDSEITYSNPALNQVRDAEVVINAQNAPGYDGIRSYLLVPPTAPPGPVSVTVTNPNGTTQQGIDLFEVVAPSDQSGSGLPSGGGTCLADEVEPVISDIVGAEPSEVYPGQEVDLRIYARGLACSATFLLFGGGIDVLSEPRVFQSPSDPSLRFFQMRIKVDVNAPLGPRAVTLLNPNGSTKSREDTFSVVSNENGLTSTACRQGWGQQGALSLLGILFFVSLYRRRERV